MEERKQTKGTVFSWTAIGVAFAGIILFLLFKFLSESKSNAVSQGQGVLTGDVSDWANILYAEIQASESYGKIFADMEKNGVKLGDAEMLRLASAIEKETDVSHIYFCSDGRIVCDGNGEKVRDCDISEYLQGDVKTFVVNSEKSGCDSGEIITSVPVEDTNDYILVIMDTSEVEKQFTISSYEEVSFIALIDRDGNILTVLGKGKDSDSMFLRDSNLFSSISQGVSGKNTFNQFKVRFLNGLDCAIESLYRGDARTVAFSKVGLESYFIAYGVRQSYVNKLINTYYASAKNTVIKLSIVVVVFSVFICSTIVFNTLRSKERGRVLEDKADTDLLTELNNKAATERKIQEYLETNPEGRALMFILDIDNFKKINDTMGHAFGDTLLRTLGKEIKTEFRVTDIIGRTGGDEFMVFLKDVNDDVIIEREAHRITRFFHDFKAGGDYVKYSASASIGAAIYPDDAKTFKDLYVAADSALYKAKKRGKNQLVFFNEDRNI